MTAWLEPGQTVPEFTLIADNGTKITPTDWRGTPTILYFYPKDDTPGCTKEACAFRDQMELFQQLGAQVIGISPDPVAAHQQFKQKYQLPFLLLADPDNVVARMFGAWRTKQMYGKETTGIQRSTFLIDSAGVVRKVWKAVKVDGHVEKVIAALQAMLISSSEGKPPI